MKKRIVSIVLIAVTVAAMLTLSAITAFAVRADDGVVAKIVELSSKGELAFEYKSVKELSDALKAGRKGNDTDNGTFHGIKLEIFADVTLSELDYPGNHELLNINLNKHTLTLNGSRNYKVQSLIIQDGTIDFCGDTGVTHKGSIFTLGIVGLEQYYKFELTNATFQNMKAGRLFKLTDSGEYCSVTDCTFKSGEFSDDGGAFDIDQRDLKPIEGRLLNVFERCDFIDLHSAGDGGAMQFYYVSCSDASRTKINMYSCNFINCSADSEGGAIYIYEMNGFSEGIPAQFYLSGCNFISCTAKDDGGAIFVDDEYIYMGYWSLPYGMNLFINCSAGGYGGALFDDNGKNKFTKMIFVGNKASDDEWGGGAMHIFGSDTVVETCEFYLNEGAGYGGAVSIDADDASFKNCIFAGNKSNKGKDIYVGSNKDAPSITGCTVYGYDSVNSLRRGSKGIGDAAKNTFNTSVMRFSDASNYGSDGALIKGDSRENPVLLTNADDDIIAFIVNLSIDPKTYKGKFYRLDCDINEVSTTINHLTGTFIDDGSAPTTCLADKPYFRDVNLVCFEHADSNGDFVCDVCGFNIGYYEFVPDSNTSFFKAERKCRTLLTEINASTTDFNLKAGWYIITENVTVNDRIYLSGDVHLILADNVTLAANQGICVGTSLLIYAQSIDPATMGKLNASTTGSMDRHAAIGSDEYGHRGDIFIHGGIITACASSATGIGSGDKGSCGNVTIYGGTVTATGGNYAAGIGSGEKGSCGNITIYGGTVTATGGNAGAGIGSGYYADCGNITINGGTVTATGGNYAAGIGPCYNANCGNISINGGVVTATGGEHAAGIGSGNAGTCGTVIIPDYLDITAGADKNSAQPVAVYKGERYVQLTESDRKTQGKGAQLSSTFSGGTLWLICGIAAAVIIGVTTYVVIKKKKKGSK